MSCDASPHERKNASLANRSPRFACGASGRLIGDWFPSPVAPFGFGRPRLDFSGDPVFLYQVSSKNEDDGYCRRDRPEDAKIMAPIKVRIATPPAMVAFCPQPCFKFWTRL